MAKMRYFYDSESEEVYSLSDVKRFFSKLVANGDIPEDESFSDYLNNCTDKNGSLEEITEKRLSDLPLPVGHWHQYFAYVNDGKGFCHELGELSPSDMRKALVCGVMENADYDEASEMDVDWVYIYIPIEQTSQELGARKEFLNSLYDLVTAMQNTSYWWGMLSYDDIERTWGDKYPFYKDFDSLVFDAMEWKEELQEKLTKD